MKLVTIRSRRNWSNWIAVRARAREIRRRMNRLEKTTQAREERRLGDSLTVLRCWACRGNATGGHKCIKCAGTGNVFWAYGRSFPYTPDGEGRAKQVIANGR
jgi:hypothetical protein